MKILKNNWQAKLISLVIAIIFWSFVIGNENPTVPSDIGRVPVIMENEETLSERGLTLVKVDNTTVDLTVTGKRNQILNLTPQHIRVYADLAKYGEGVHNIKLRYDLPEGLSLKNKVDSVNVDIQKVINKDFMVDIDLEGKLGQNYILEATKSTPEKITVVGPRSVVESIDSVKAYLDLTNLEEDLVINANVYPVDSDGEVIENVTLGQKFVNINASVSKTKEVEIDFVTEGELKDDLKLIKLSLDPKRVYVKGPKDLIEKLEKIKTSPINLSKVERDEEVPFKLNLPDGISLVHKDKDLKAHIEVEEKQEKTLDFKTSDIRLMGKSSKQEVKLSPEKIGLTIKGFEDDLKNIDPDDFRLSLDINNKPAGSYNIKPTVTTSSEGDFEVVKIDSVKIVIDEN